MQEKNETIYKHEKCTYGGNKNFFFIGFAIFYNNFNSFSIFKNFTKAIYMIFFLSKKFDGRRNG